MDLLVKALPFQVLEYEEGVLLKRGLSQILVSGNGALERVLIILTSTSGKVSSIKDICDQFAALDRPGVEALIVDLLDKKFLVSASDTTYDSSGDQFDVFLGQFKRSQKNIIIKLSALRIIFVGINSLNYSIFSSLKNLGVDHMTFLDDPLLRNQRFINSKGILQSEISHIIQDNIINADELEERVNDNPPSCLIASSDFGGQALLLKWNQFCIQHNIDFLPVYLQDMVGYVGPLIVPGETACLQCIRTRQNAHLRDLDIRKLVELNASQGQSIAAIHPAAIGMLANTAFFELSHFYGDLPFPRPGRLIRIDLMGGETIRGCLARSRRPGAHRKSETCPQ